MDKPLISFLSFLLLIELAVLFADLGFLPARFLPTSISNQSKQNQKIGQISYLENKVRRKFDQSIVWTESKAQEDVYNQDSVLTLKDSSAKIKLDGNIQIKLYENTLIVIKAPEETKKDNGLKIQFAKGNLRSKLRDEKIALESDSWSFQPSKNSDISFRSTTDKSLEIEVNEGSIQIRNKKTPEEIKEFKKGNSLSLESSGEVQTKSISADFRWKNTEKESRFYFADNQSSQVHLKWQGNASKLSVFSSTTGKNNFEIDKNTNELKLALPAGHYFAKLENENKVSESFEFEVVEAKYFTYFSPYPRDRILNQDEYLFSWEATPNIQKYKLEFSRDESFQEIEESHISDNNSLLAKVQTSGPLYWRILAYDEKGSFYPNKLKYPIYSITEALAAPNLKGIQKSRIPASKQETLKKKNNENKNKDSTKEKAKLKSTSQIESKKGVLKNVSDLETNSPNKNIWQKLKDSARFISQLFVIASAQAQDYVAEDKEVLKKYEYKFEWSAVEGADFYIIEISKSSDFQDLVFESQSTDNSLNWESSHTGKVFWRVSAGAYNGLMGVFSEPMEVNLSEIEIHKKIVKISKPKKKLIKKTKQFVVNKDPLPEKPKVLLPKVEEQKLDPKLTKASNHFTIAYYASYGKAKGLLLDEQAKYKFTGIKPIDFEVQFTRKSKIKKYYSSSLRYHRSKWEAESASYSFQEKISSEQIFWDHYFLFAGKWSFGINLQKREFPARSGNESIDFQSKNLYGISIMNEQNFQKANLPEKMILQNRISGIGSLYDISGSILAKWNIKSNSNYQIHFDAGFQYNLRSNDAKDFSHYTEVQIGLSIDWGSFPSSQEDKQN